MDHLRKVSGVHQCVVFLLETGVDFHSFGVFDYMRYVPPSPVGHYGCEICDLQRSGTDFSLPDGKRDDIGGFPAFASVDFIVAFGSRDVASEFGRKVAPEFLSETEAQHILPPFVESIVNRIILFVFQQVLEYVAEIGVTAHHHGLVQVERTAVGMASKFAGLGVCVTPAARKLVPGLQHPFLQAYQPVYEFEYRSRGIGCLHGAVKHRPSGICSKAGIVGSHVR